MRNKSKGIGFEMSRFPTDQTEAETKSWQVTLPLSKHDTICINNFYFSCLLIIKTKLHMKPKMPDDK